MTWSTRLKQELPREQIPAFLTELQALVAAMRDDADWSARITPLLREHAQLALDYMQDGAKKEAVRKALS